MAVQRFLRERHRTRDSIDSVRLVITMLVTFAALVLGLLTSSVKETFDRDGQELRAYAVDLIELDHRLREYGAAADPARELLAAYTAASIASTWPGEAAPAGAYPRLPPQLNPTSLGSKLLLAMLNRMDALIRQLPADDAERRAVQAAATARMADVLTQRWKLVEMAHRSISWPFVTVLVSWLVIVFLTFGLSSPRNGLVLATIGLSALSIASVIYVILDFDSPLGGFVQISSEPLRDALTQMRAPPEVDPSLRITP